MVEKVDPIKGRTYHIIIQKETYSMSYHNYHINHHVNLDDSNLKLINVNQTWGFGISCISLKVCLTAARLDEFNLSCLRELSICKRSSCYLDVEFNA